MVISAKTNVLIADAPFHISDRPTEAELLGKYFTVLADPTRIRILEALDEHGELSVGELVDALGVSQPNVSNHLACLRWCGFVTTRRQHRMVYNRIADRRVTRLVRLGRELLEENEEHIASCRRV